MYVCNSVCVHSNWYSIYVFVWSSNHRMTVSSPLSFFFGILYYNELDVCVILIDVLKSYPDVGSSRASFRRAASSRSIRSNRRRDSMFPGINGRFEIDVFILHPSIHPSIFSMHTYIHTYNRSCSVAEVETKTPTCRLSRPGASSSIVPQLFFFV